MLEEYERKKRKQVAVMRAIKDYSMGFIILLLGLFFFFRDRFDNGFNRLRPPDDIDKIFGAVCIVYGVWRIYRGYKKNYFR
jgi:cytochrome c biogenesis protein CcdA